MNHHTVAHGETGGEGQEDTAAETPIVQGGVQEEFSGPVEGEREIMAVSGDQCVRSGLQEGGADRRGRFESGRAKPTEAIARKAEEALNAGKAIWKRWLDYEATKAREVKPAAEMSPPQRRPDQPYATGSALVVEHDTARLDYGGSLYRLTMRRLLRNTGDQPITRYLIRISVDRYPGEPERSNAHYREHPLTWDELALTATCRGEGMRWETKHDRDAFKEVWLLFENDQGRFPLYPGESVWIEYAYSASDTKWGRWLRSTGRPAEPGLTSRVRHRRSGAHALAADSRGLSAPCTRMSDF